MRRGRILWERRTVMGLPGQWALCNYGNRLLHMRLISAGRRRRKQAFYNVTPEHCQSQPVTSWGLTGAAAAAAEAAPDSGGSSGQRFRSFLLDQDLLICSECLLLTLTTRGLFRKIRFSESFFWSCRQGGCVAAKLIVMYLIERLVGRIWIASPP